MRKIVFALCLVLTLTATSMATTLRSLDAGELAQLADRIFAGEVLSVERAMDASQFRVMIVTVRVTEGIKNTYTGEIVVFKQIDEMIPGLPHYQAGEQVMLFLAGVSRLGLTAPLGLGQGRFRLGGDQPGHEALVNDFQNEGLFHLSKALARSEALSDGERRMVTQRRGPVERQTFVRFIRREAAKEVVREQ